MDVSNRIDEGIFIAAIRGDFLLDEAKEFKSYIKPHLENNSLKGILINFKNVDVLDSSGIGLLVSIFRNSQKKGKLFGICDLNNENMEKLVFTQLNKVLTIYDIEENALKEMKGKS